MHHTSTPHPFQHRVTGSCQFVDVLQDLSRAPPPGLRPSTLGANSLPLALARTKQVMLPGWGSPDLFQLGAKEIAMGILHGGQGCLSHSPFPGETLPAKTQLKLLKD